jgi:hypothetical protein
VAANVDQDDAVIRLQCRNEASLVPSFAAVAEAVLKDERWSITLDPIVDRNALVINAGHQILPCVRMASKTMRPFTTQSNVRMWPKADVPSSYADVRFWGQSGHCLVLHR